MKNYASTVPAYQSIFEIEQALIKFGASHISKDYDGERKVAAIAFAVVNPETKLPIHIRLPANPDAVCDVLRKGKKNFQHRQMAKLREQSERTAWRLMLDWVKVQLSLIEMDQAELQQVFMPYVWSGTVTLYQALKEQRLPMLGFSPKAAEAEDGDHAAV